MARKGRDAEEGQGGRREPGREGREEKAERGRQEPQLGQSLAEALGSMGCLE